MGDREELAIDVLGRRRVLERAEARRIWRIGLAAAIDVTGGDAPVVLEDDPLTGPGKEDLLGGDRCGQAHAVRLNGGRWRLVRAEERGVVRLGAEADAGPAEEDARPGRVGGSRQLHRDRAVAERGHRGACRRDAPDVAVAERRREGIDRVVHGKRANSANDETATERDRTAGTRALKGDLGALREVGLDASRVRVLGKDVLEHRDASGVLVRGDSRVEGHAKRALRAVNVGGDAQLGILRSRASGSGSAGSRGYRGGAGDRRRDEEVPLLHQRRIAANDRHATELSVAACADIKTVRRAVSEIGDDFASGVDNGDVLLARAGGVPLDAGEAGAVSVGSAVCRVEDV